MLHLSKTNTTRSRLCSRRALTTATRSSASAGTTVWCARRKGVHVCDVKLETVRVCASQRNTRLEYNHKKDGEVTVREKRSLCVPIRRRRCTDHGCSVVMLPEGLHEFLHRTTAAPLHALPFLQCTLCCGPSLLAPVCQRLDLQFADLVYGAFGRIALDELTLGRRPTQCSY